LITTKYRESLDFFHSSIFKNDNTGLSNKDIVDIYFSVSSTTSKSTEMYQILKMQLKNQWNSRKKITERALNISAIP
jgi:hypothetical protein